jgi:hypothetical protein
MKEFIFVAGVNVRKLIDDLGYLILLDISRMSIPIHEICNAVELSNYSFVYSRLKFDEKKWLWMCELSQFYLIFSEKLHMVRIISVQLE